MYPPGSVLRRQAGATYTFNGTKATVFKGMKVLIPVWAIQRDPEIYPDPDKFDPERFDEDNVNNRHPMSYLPFGDGPHNCIGKGNSFILKSQIKTIMLVLIEHFFHKFGFNSHRCTFR